MAKVERHYGLPDDTKVEVISILKKDRDKVYKKVMSLGDWKELNRNGRVKGYDYHCFQLGRSAFKNAIEVI